MKMDDTMTVVPVNSQKAVPTPMSTWHELVGTPLTVEILEWPADLFALTNVILKRTEAFRFVLSPPTGEQWPPSCFPSWSDVVEEAGRQWSEWVENRKSPFPDVLVEEWSVFFERGDTPLEDLADGRDLRMCEAVLTLHAIADEACAGLGIGLDRSGGKGCLYRARGRELLARTGSLARIQAHSLRVLPKVRTPPNGTSFRSFSPPASALCGQSGVDATLDTPIRARSRSNGSRSLRMSPLLIARFTSASIVRWVRARDPSYSFEGPPTSAFSARAMICFVAM